MKNYTYSKNRNSQQGFAVLAVSLIMLFLITTNVFMGAKSSIIEQQTSTNSYAYEIALNNAEAGISAMLKQLTNGVALPPAILGTDANSKQIYKVTYISPYITSVGNGVSGSSSIQRAVIQRVKPSQPGVLTNAPAAINTLGNVTMGGNYTATSVNSGGRVDGKRENAGLITEKSATFQVNITSSDGTILLGGSGKPLTRLMTPDELFMFFFGSTFCHQAYLADSASQCIPEANGFIASSPKGVICDINCGPAFLTQYNSGKRFFWVTNGLSINNSSGISQTSPLGSDADPVYIFIMDNSQLSFNGNSLINGVIYVHTPATTYSCTCRASDSVSSFSNTSLTVDDTTKTPVVSFSRFIVNGIATVSGNKNNQVTAYANICYPTTGSSTCSTSLTDVNGKLATVITNGGMYLPDTTKAVIISYPQTSVKIAVWSSSSYSLYGASNPSQCTASSCSSASNVCQPPNLQSVSTKVGDISTCNYQTPAIDVITDNSGVSADVIIQVLNNSSFTGTGNSQVRGALITSGNISSTNGNGSVVSPSGINSNLVGRPIAIDPKGWTDIVQ